MAPRRSFCLLLAAAPSLLHRAAAEGPKKASFCCLAAADLGNVCGSCFPAAVARPDSECGPSEGACAACGKSTTWCQGDDEGVPAAAAADAQEDQAPAEPELVVSDADAGAGGDDAASVCAADGEDCSGPRCCASAGHKCFRKNAWWSSCRSTCAPGLDPNDPPEARTPWECTILSSASSAKEIVIMLTEPPVGLEEGSEVTIELGDAPADGGSTAPKLQPQARSDGGGLSPFLAFEGAAAVGALLAAGYYYVESRRKAAALQAVNAFGKASPGAPSPGTLESGRPGLSRWWSGGRGGGDGGAAAFSSPARPRASQQPPSPAQSLQSSFFSLSGLGRQV